MIDLKRLVPLSTRKVLRQGEAIVRNGAVRFLAGRKRLECDHPVEIFGKDGRDVFFGYFDITPFSSNGKRLLAHRTMKSKAEPELDDVEVGYFDRRDGTFNHLGKTHLWCWQMGARLRWVGEDTVAFNTLVDGAYGAALIDADSGATRRAFSTPLYDISPDGSWGLSLDFSRLQRLRPGYGYSRLSDLTVEQKCPDQSGVFLLDMKSGKSRLLVSVAQIAAQMPLPDMSAAHHYLNHLSFAPSGTRFGVFHIWQDQKGRRFNRLLLFDLAGSLQGIIADQRHVSHIAWQTDSRVLAFAAMPGDKRPTYQVIDFEKAQWTPVLGGTIDRDGHPSLSPIEANIFVSDAYPDKVSYRSLYTADMQSNRLTSIGAFHSPPFLAGAKRCDLHPRWSRDGTSIAVDTAHLGRRALAVIKLRGEL